MGTNLGGQFEGTSTVERVGQSSDPDGRIGVNPRAVLDGLLGRITSRESGESSIGILLLLPLVILSFILGLELLVL